MLPRRPAHMLRVGFVLVIVFCFLVGLLLDNLHSDDHHHQRGPVSRNLLGFENKLQGEEQALPSGINSFHMGLDDFVQWMADDQDKPDERRAGKSHMGPFPQYKELPAVAYVRQTEKEALLKHMNAFVQRMRPHNSEKLRLLHKLEKTGMAADRVDNSKEEHDGFERHQTAFIISNMTTEQQPSASASVKQQSLNAFRKMVITSDPQEQLVKEAKERFPKQQQGVEGLLKSGQDIILVKLEQENENDDGTTTEEKKNSSSPAAETEGKKDNLDHTQELRLRKF